MPVLRLTVATQPSAVSVFLSVAKCGRVCRAQTCALSGIEPSTLAEGFLRGGPKVRKNFEFLTISSLYHAVYQSPYCYVVFRCSAVLLFPLKG